MGMLGACKVTVTDEPLRGLEVTSTRWRDPPGAPGGLAIVDSTMPSAVSTARSSVAPTVPGTTTGGAVNHTPPIVTASTTTPMTDRKKPTDGGTPCKLIERGVERRAFGSPA